MRLIDSKRKNTELLAIFFHVGPGHLKQNSIMKIYGFQKSRKEMDRRHVQRQQCIFLAPVLTASTSDTLPWNTITAPQSFVSDSSSYNNPRYDDDMMLATMDSCRQAIHDANNLNIITRHVMFVPYVDLRAGQP